MARARINAAETFAILERCVASGGRCPVAGAEGLTSQLTGELARSGKIRIDVYPQNYRVVTIMEGPHAGKATAPPPNKNWQPYLTIQKDSEPRQQVRRNMPGRAMMHG